MDAALQIRNVNVTRYVTALREGGSLPAIAEADDGFLYVLKFSGAGQDVKALIAELIGEKIAKALGLKVPEIVLANLDEAFGAEAGEIGKLPIAERFRWLTATRSTVVQTSKVHLGVV